MGLFSSIKKIGSKAWGGIKKAVKGVAKGVKKVAKGIVTSTPWGQKLWKKGGEIGTKIMNKVGKFMNKLGPVGSMALSFVLAPVVGPALGAMWSSFGAGAAAMATSANAFVATLGNVGSGIFAAGNWVGGTLGAMGNALTEGASNVMSGNFSAAAKSFASNMSSAFSGEAGMAAVNAGSAVANAAAATNVSTGNSLFAGSDAASQVAQLQGNVATSVDALNQMGAAGQEALGRLTAEQLQSVAMNNPNAIQSSIESGVNLASPVQDVYDPISGEYKQLPKMSVNPVTAEDYITMTPEQIQAQVSQMGATSTSINMQNAINGNTAYGNAAVMGGPVAGQTAALGQAAINTAASQESKSLLDRAKQAVDLLGGSGSEGGYQPYVPSAIKSVSGTRVGQGQGQGSAGFSLLSGVQGLEQSIRNSTNMMFG